MKKFLFVLVVSLVSVMALAQRTVTAYKSVRGIWSDSLNEFVFNEPVFSELTIKMYSDLVTVSDRAHSIYRVQSGGKLVKGEAFDHVKWECKDEEDIRCNVIFMMDNPSGIITLNVIYNDVCYTYFITDTERKIDSKNSEEKG